MDCLDGVFEANIQQRRLENSPHISDTAKTLFSNVVYLYSNTSLNMRDQQAKPSKPNQPTAAFHHSLSLTSYVVPMLKRVLLVLRTFEQEK